MLQQWQAILRLRFLRSEQSRLSKSKGGWVVVSSQTPIQLEMGLELAIACQYLCHWETVTYLSSEKANRLTLIINHNQSSNYFHLGRNLFLQFLKTNYLIFREYFLLHFALLNLKPKHLEVGNFSLHFGIKVESVKTGGYFYRDLTCHWPNKCIECKMSTWKASRNKSLL